jgi:DNA-binding response OmpR family regulator
MNHKGKIVVVDDSEICRDLVKHTLESEGYQVMCLDTPFGLSRMVNRERPDLVLVDVSMPGLQGDKLIECLLSHRLHRCPLVLHSDKPEAELQQLVRSSGAAGFIAKRTDGAELAQAVAAFLARADLASRN